MVKTNSGFTNGQFDYVDVSQDETIGGNLTVGGIITGSIVGPTTSAGFFLATDTSNQYRSASTIYDLKSTTTVNPVFRFKGSDDTTTNGVITVGNANFTALTGQSVLIQSTDDVAGVLGPGSFKTLGGACITKNALVGGNLVVLGSISGTSSSVTGGFTAGLFVATNTTGVNLTCNSTDDATGVAGVGSISTLGGIYIGRKAYIATNLTVASTSTFGDTVTASTNTFNPVFSGTNTLGNGVGIRITTNYATSGSINTFNNTSITAGTSGGPLYMATFTWSTSNGAGFNRNIGILVGIGTGATFGFGIYYNSDTKITTLGHTVSGVGITTVGIQIAVGGVTTFQCAVASTTTTTGSVVVVGGVGIGGALNVGGNCNVGGNIVCTGTITGASIIGPVGGTAAAFTATNVTGVNLTCSSTTDATSVTGSILTPGGACIQKAIYIGTTATIVGATGCASVTSTGTFTASAATGTTLAISSTTDSSSVGTGSAILLGGLSVAKNGYFGGNIVCTGSITGASIVGPIGGTAAAFIATNTTGTNYFANSTTDSSSISTGSIQTLGGFGCAKTGWFGGSLNALGAIFTGSTLTVTSTTTTNHVNVLATTTLNGTVDSFGLFTHNNVLNIATASGTSLVVASSENSTSTTTGAIVVTSGGLGVGANIYCGSRITCSATTGTSLAVLSTTNSTNYLSGCAVLSGGLGIGGNTFTLGNISTAGVLTLSNTTPSTNVFLIQNTSATVSPTTGAMVCSGGFGLGGSLICGGNIAINSGTLYVGNTTPSTNVFFIQNTTNSTSPTSGAGVINGGLGVGGDIHCGGSIYQNTNQLIFSTGSWSPSLVIPGLGAISLTYTTRYGNWYRWGNLLTITFTLVYSYTDLSGGTGNVLYMRNLPVVPTSNSRVAGSLNPQATQFDGVNGPFYCTTDTTDPTSIYFYDRNSNIVVNFFSFSGSGKWAGTLTYEV